VETDRAGWMLPVDAPDAAISNGARFESEADVCLLSHRDVGTKLERDPVTARTSAARGRRRRDQNDCSTTTHAHRAPITIAPPQGAAPPSSRRQLSEA